MEFLNTHRLPVPRNTSAIGDNSGFHDLAKIPYVAAGVFHTGLTLQDNADVFAMVVSHELAEMVVDPKVDFANPEVCRACDINCGNLTRVYFDAGDHFLGVNQASPPGGFPFNYYICAIVKPSGAASSPAAAADCQYGPRTPSLQFIIEKSTFGQDEVELQLPGTASFAPSYWLAVDGFDTSELGFNTPSDLSNPVPHPTPAITATLDPVINSGLTAAQLTAIGARLPTVNSYGPLPAVAEDPTLGQLLQRILYPYTVSFPDDGLFQRLDPDQSVIITLTATLTVGTVTLSQSANTASRTGRPRSWCVALRRRSSTEPASSGDRPADRRGLRCRLDRALESAGASAYRVVVVAEM